MWPDEEAKKYFFDCPLKNAADKYKLVYAKERPLGDFEQFGRYCGVFRTAQPYKALNPGRPNMDISPEEQMKLDKMDRYCLHYACKKTFKQVDNHRKACKCHTGKWDFGFKSHGEGGDVLWDPHWTCCNSRWDTEGCTVMEHGGPFVEDYKQAPRKHEWPDEEAINYFFKKGEPTTFH
jgi:hypothetical protein